MKLFFLLMLNDVNKYFSHVRSTRIEDGRICVTISIAGTQHVFKGVGRNTRFAKNAASKYALHVLRNL